MILMKNEVDVIATYSEYEPEYDTFGPFFTCCCCYRLFQFAFQLFSLLKKVESSNSNSMLSRSTPFSQAATKATIATKQIWILRHGQAHHNVRAEEKRKAGCSYQEFLDWMQKDDKWDADLTDLGEQQAQQHQPIVSNANHPIQLVVSSPLSRALRTADLAFPPLSGAAADESCIIQRICKEDFREVNGWLQNAKRRCVTDLQQRFAHWDFDELQEHDQLWTNDLECTKACAERGYKGLCWIKDRPEQSILLVSHGGLLRHTLTEHPNVQLRDERTPSTQHQQQHQPTSAQHHSQREVSSRFNNGELRKFLLSWDGEESRPILTVTEVDVF